MPLARPAQMPGNLAESRKCRWWWLPNTCVRLPCLRQPRELGAGPVGGLASYIGAQSCVGHRIEQAVDRSAIEVSRHAGVRGKQIGERAPLDRGRLGCVVNDVVRILAAERRAELEHDRLGHDQAAAKVEVGAHPFRIELEPAYDRV
jgi:hypothetical protein